MEGDMRHTGRGLWNKGTVLGMRDVEQGTWIVEQRYGARHEGCGTRDMDCGTKVRR